MATDPNNIPGYDYGTARVPRSPVTLQQLEELKQAAGFNDEDQRYLKMSGEVLSPQAEDIVDAWRAKIGAQEELRKWFAGPDGKLDERYKSAVKPRFVQWVTDLCLRPYDQAWLDYQDEIGRRHTPEKKNVTDGVQAPPVVPLRYVLSFTAVVINNAREFLEKSRYLPDDIEQMHRAWTKAVILTITLWSRPYTKDELW